MASISQAPGHMRHATEIFNGIKCLQRSQKQPLRQQHLVTDARLLPEAAASLQEVRGKILGKVQEHDAPQKNLVATSSHPPPSSLYIHFNTCTPNRFAPSGLASSPGVSASHPSGHAQLHPTWLPTTPTASSLWSQFLYGSSVCFKPAEGEALTGSLLTVQESPDRNAKAECIIKPGKPVISLGKSRRRQALPRAATCRLPSRTSEEEAGV